VNVTVAVWVIVTLSVVSVAVKTSSPAIVDFTVNVTTPDASLGPEAALIVGAPGPLVFARLTVFPATGLPFASFSVTVIAEVVVPSATTEVGNAVAVDWLALTAPAAMVTAPLVPVFPFAEVAVKVWFPIVPLNVSLPVTFATPFTKSAAWFSTALFPDPRPLRAPSLGADESVTLFAEASKLVIVFPKASFAVIVFVPVNAAPLACGEAKETSK